MTKQIQIQDRVVLSEKARATRDAIAETIDAMLCEQQEKILDHENRIYRGRWSEKFQASKQARHDELVSNWSLFFSHLDEDFLMSKRQQDAAFDSMYQNPDGAQIVMTWMKSTMDRCLADMEKAEKAFIAA